MGGISALKNFWSNGLRGRVNILSDFILWQQLDRKFSGEEEDTG